MEVNTTEPSSDDYWSWTPSVDAAEAEETFSASHMEEQLLRDAQRRSQKVETVTAATEQVMDEGYWDEVSETDSTDESPAAQAQHYWEWTSDAKHVLSSESIVDNLVCQSNYLKSKSVGNNVTSTTAGPANYWDEHMSSNTVQAARTHASYWHWESDAKAKLIQLILKEEEARVLCSASHLETNLVQAATDAYWNESPQETMSDKYWNWESTPKQVALTGADATNYWNW